MSERVAFSVSSLMGEGAPIGDVVATAFDMLRAKALPRLRDEDGYLPCDELDGSVIGWVRGESWGPEKPSDSRGVVTQAEDALVPDGKLVALLNDDPNGDGHRKEF
jgi:hypothetical protein